MKNIILSIGLLFLAAGVSYGKPHISTMVYDLDYIIENNSDAVLTIKFRYEDPNYISQRDDWERYEAKLARGESNEQFRELTISCKPGERAGKRITRFGIGSGFYEIVIDGKEMASGPIGPSISVTAPVKWNGVKDKAGKFIFSLNSDYNLSTATADFMFVLNNNIEKSEKDL